MRKLQNDNSAISISEISLGNIISHYRIIEKIGSGGMGVVFKSEDLRLNRNVALKFLAPHLVSSRENQSRFFREARSASALNHPNICTIYDFDEADGHSFIVMEYVDGESIRSKIKNKSLNLQETIGLARQILAGLEAAHGKGVVHRDIKPDNVLVTKAGLAKIMDFGLASIIQQDDSTRTAMLMGTPNYMSPEHVQGQLIDQRSDIFSFGIMLYEMISGRLPFEGDSFSSVMYSIAHSAPQKLEELISDIHSGLSNIVSKCLAKSPQRRYASCKELLADIDSLDIQPAAKDASTASATFQTKPASQISEYSIKHFVGREEDFRVVRDLIDNARDGIGSTIVIKGEAGIGKTQLARKAVEYGRKWNMNIFWGRCLYKEGGLPYYPFASALKRDFNSFEQSAFDDLIAKGSNSGIDLAISARIFKSFLNIGEESSGLINKEQLWEAVLLFLKLISTDRPSIFVIDDFHWIDLASLGLFSFLARNIADIPLLLLITCRETEGQPDGGIVNNIDDCLRQLKVENLLRQVSLRRFAPEEATSYISMLLDNQKIDDAAARTIYDRTQGNPLFISELLILLKSENAIFFNGKFWQLKTDVSTPVTSERIRDIILLRLGRLSEANRELLDVAACEGQYFHSEALIACLGIPKIPLLKRLQALEKEHSIIHHEKDRYQFDHPLVRDIIYEGILDELRAEYHRLIGSWLIREHEASDDYASQIAYHLTSSGQEVPALEYLARAARRSSELHAHNEALDYYQKANNIIENHPNQPLELRAAIIEGYADSLASLGRVADAQIHYNELLNLHQANLPERMKIAALRKLGDTYRIIGRTEDAVNFLNEALDLARRKNETNELIECLNNLGFAYFSRVGDWALAVNCLEESLALSRSVNSIKNQAISCGYLGLTYLHKGELATSANWLEQAIDIQRSISDERGISQTLNFLGLLYDRMGVFEQAISSFTESTRLKKKFGDMTAIPGTLNGLGDTYRDLYDMEKAIECHGQSLDMAREQKNIGAQCDNLRDLGVDYMKVGDLSKAREYLEDVLTLARSSGHTWYETRTCTSLAELELLSGNLELAIDFADSALVNARNLNASELIIDALWINARLLHAGDGREGDAAAALAEGIGMARHGGYNVLLWQLLLELANYYSDASQDELSHSCLIEAREVLNSILNRFLDDSLSRNLRDQPAVAAVIASR